MNHTYKTLYNTALGAWVAVPETARNHGKTKSVKTAAVAIAVASALFSSPVQAAGLTWGTGAKAPGNGSIAMGDNSDAKTIYTIALGTNAKNTSNGDSAIIIGNEAKAVSDANPATGRNTTGQQVVIGEASEANSQSVALGAQVYASGQSSIAIGGDDLGNNDSKTSAGKYGNWRDYAGQPITVEGVSTKDASNPAIGFTSTTASGRGSIAVGHMGQSTGKASVAIGADSHAEADGAIATGMASQAKGVASVATGIGATAGAKGAIATGLKAAATGTDAIATGTGARAGARNDVAIGHDAGAVSGKATTGERVMIGANATVGANKNINVAAGGTFGSINLTTKTANQSVAIGGGSGDDDGRRTYAYGDQSLAIGSDTLAYGDGSVAIGGDDLDSAGNQQTSYTDPNSGAQTTGTVRQAYNALTGDTMNSGVYAKTVSKQAAVAVGVQAQAADLGVALGAKSGATKTNSVAIGTGAQATLDNAVAIGGGSKTLKAGTKQESTTINGVTYNWAGGGSTLPGDIVSFGATDYERQLKHVAAGEVSATSTDAINGSQLYAVASTLQAGQTHYYSVNSTLQGTGSNYNNDGATGANALAAGAAASAAGTSATAVGHEANASGTHSIAIGNKAKTNESQFGIAIGYEAELGGTGKNTSIAIGKESKATALDSIAIGRGNKALDDGTIALGTQVNLQGIAAIGIGQNVSTQQRDGIAIGNSAKTGLGENNTAIGSYADANVGWSTAVGTRAYTNGNGAVALGTMAHGGGQRSTAIGSFSYSKALTSTALGYHTIATDSANYSTALGTGTVVSGASSGGWSAAPHGNPHQFDNSKRSYIGGTGNYAIGNTNIIGNQTSNSVALGNNIQLGATSATLTSVDPSGKGNSIATRKETVNFGGVTALTNAVAVGNSAKVAANNGVSLGANAETKYADDVALGANAVTAAKVATNDATVSDLTYSGFAGNNPIATVSVGTKDKERTITNVAAGRISKESTDAINGSQLYAIANRLQAGQTHYYSVNDGGTRGGNYNNDGATAANTLAAGVNAKAGSSNSVAMGDGADTSNFANGQNKGLNTAIGSNAKIGAKGKTSWEATAVGADTVAEGVRTTAIGYGASATEYYATAIGYKSTAPEWHALAIGSQATVAPAATTDVAAAQAITTNLTNVRDASKSAAAIAIGRQATAAGYGAIAQGLNTQATTAYATAIGANAKASKVGSTAFGAYAVAEADSSVALGRYSHADREKLEGSPTLGADPLGVGAQAGSLTWQSNAGAVSVGSSNNRNYAGVDVPKTTRQIINLAAGSADTDAVNVAQLKAAGFNLAVSQSGGTSADNTVNAADKKINNGKTLTFDAGNGIDLQQDGGKITIATNAQAITDNAQLPVVYTKADGSKVYKRGNKFYDAPVGGNEVAAADVIASMQNAAGSTSKPTTLANVASNFADTANVTSNPANNARANFANKGNNAATVNDVLNAGFNVQGNGVAKDFVTHGDTINFANGRGTVANVSTDQTTGTTTVKFDTPLEYQDTSGNASTTPTNTVKLVGGDANKPVTLQNVAAGTNDTDAVNVSQLNEVKTTANKGWNVQTNGSGTTNVAPGDTVNFKNGTNIAITHTGKEITIATNPNLTADSLTINNGGPVINNGGINMGNKSINNMADGNIANGSKEAVNGGQLFQTNQKVDANTANIAKGINFGGTSGANKYQLGDTINVKGDSNITSTTVNGGVQLGLGNKITVGPASGGNPVTIDGNAGTVGGLSNKTWNPNSIVSGQAATEDQLKAVATEAAKKGSFTLTAQGANGSTVGDGATVDLNNTDGNISVSKNAANNNVTFNLAKDIKVDSVKAGDSTINNDGLKITGGPSVTKTGIDAADKKITNVADGNIAAGSKDAVNGGQLHNEISKLNTNIAAAKTEVQSTDKSVTVDGSKKNPTTGATIYDLSVNTDGTTITKDANGKIKANTTTLTTTAGKVNTPAAADAGKLMTAGEIANAINNSGFTLTTSASSGTVSGTSNQLINPGNTMTLDAGKNINIIQDGRKVTVATKDQVEFTQVTTTDAAGNKTVTNGNGVTITPAAGGGNPVSLTNNGLDNGGNKITNVADGVADSDAANVKQVKAARTEVKAGTNIASVDKTQANDGHDIYTVNAKGTTVSGAGDVIVTATNTGGNVTNYEVSLSNGTKQDIGKGVQALNIVQTQGLTFHGDSGSTGMKKLGDSVAIMGDGNIRTAADAGGVQVKLNPDVNVNSVTTGDTRMSDAGVAINNGPSMTKQGIDAGNLPIRNVAPGRIARDSRDAVNGAQLYALGRHVDNVDKRAKAGTASAIATAGLPQAYRPGASMVAAAGGYYDGQSAVAIGVSTISDNGKWIIKGAANVNSKEAGAVVGIGYQW
ncbi:YadA-like family protein [Cardiobacterium hominis]|uniref:YadA-like family protein n=1 Tax=Cardiobacterium hominis TaxID=2718 RepID=UPI0028E8477C|nr:YadA-like family protein [Cardiobacterium hominis]